VSLTYDASNRVSQVTDAAGRSLTFNYANSNFPNQVSSIQDSVGVIASYNYTNSGSISGLLSSVTYADNSIINFNYDTNGLILSTTDTNGKILETHTYDSSRRGLTSARANGVDQVTVTYNSDGSATLSDSKGNATSYGTQQIQKRNYVASIAGTGCASCGGRDNHSFTYDTQGNRTSSKDPLGHTTALSYDSIGNVTQVQVQMDNVPNYQNWSYSYNGFGEALTGTDPLNHTTTNTYDASGNLLSITTPSPNGTIAGSKTSFTYDTKGQLLTITDPKLNNTTIAYTSAGLIDSITDAQNKVTKYTYDARGNRLSITQDYGTGGLNLQTAFTYDVMNRLTKITYPTTPATFTQYAYDSRGRKISATDENNKVTNFAYDDADRLVSITDAQTPTASVTQYVYDTENNLTSITDALNHQTTFLYDADSRITQTTFPSTFYETSNYDAAGNLLSKTDRNAHTVNYTYDFLNRLTKKQYPDGTSMNYTYDVANRLTQVTDSTGTYTLAYDNMDRLMQASTVYSFIAGKTFMMQYGYDAASNRTSMTDPQSKATSYVYDTLNRLTTLTFPARTNYNFTYDALGRRSKLSRPNKVTTTYQYDSLSQLLSLLHQVTTKSGTTTLDGATYAYDPAGNRTSKVDKRTNVTSNFSFDPIYQLTGVAQSSSTTESYSYDLVGNRQSSLGVSPYMYNISNELTSVPGVTYTYDNNGNILTKVDSTGTTAYNWDFENRLTSVQLPGTSGTVNFKYDPFGHRIQKSSSAGTTNYLYDGADLLEEVDGSGTLMTRYTQSGGIDQSLATTQGKNTYYYEADGLGSITSLSNSSGSLVNTYNYDSFGKLVSSSGTISNRFRYTGREYDGETGLYYYRARYYSPQLGRFIAEDPLKFGGGDMNFYAYAENDPIDFVDPFGLRVYPSNFIGPLLPGDVRGFFADLTDAAISNLTTFPYPSASRYFGESQQCVSLTKHFTGLPCTDCWRAGPRVLGNDIPRGVAIATFDENGRYPADVHQNSGIHLGIGDAPNTITILDQWPGHLARRRTLFPMRHGMADNANAYSVITVPPGTKSSQCQCER